MSEQEVWLRAWLAVAGTFNAKLPDCTRYADACLAGFRERFPGAANQDERLARVQP